MNDLIRQQYPRVEAACVAVKAAMALKMATTGLERRAAERTEQAAQDDATSAYAEELLPVLFGGEWRLSTRHAKFPAAVLNLGRHRYCPSLHAIFDHPLVFRSAGTRGPDSYKNIVIVGRPYPIVGDDGELASAARDNAAWLASLGWGCWWRRDLSSWYPGWTQLVIAKHDLQACRTPDGLTPIASAAAGVVWDKYKDLPAGWRG